MNQDTEEQQVQYRGRNGTLGAARGHFDWFAYGVYALSPDAGYSKCLVEAGLLALALQPIRDVI